MRMRPAQRLWPEYEDGKMQLQLLKCNCGFCRLEFPGCLPGCQPCLVCVALDKSLLLPSS